MSKIVLGVIVGVVIGCLALVLFGSRPDGTERTDPAPTQANAAPEVPATSVSETRALPGDVTSLPDQAPTPGAEADSSVRTWSENPEYMEALVLAALTSAGVEMLSLDSNECTPTECQIRFTSQEAQEMGPSRGAFTEAVREPPISAVGIRKEVEETDGLYAHTFTLRSYADRPTQEELGRFSISAAQLRDLAEDRLAPGDRSAGPATLGRVGSSLGTVEIVAENVCSYDCSSDRRQMIHLALPDGVTCARARGIEETIMAQTSVGGLEERTFCVPNTLAGN